jgi:hypothetical protein
MKLYVEPYIWNHEDPVLMKSKILRKGHYTIDISRILVYVCNKRYILINAPRKDIFFKTLTSIVDPVNNAWLSKYFMILANLFSMEKYGLAYDNDFLAIGWSIIGEKEFAGYAICVWSHNPDPRIYPVKEYVSSILEATVEKPCTA